MGQVPFALAQQPVNQEKVKNALIELKKANQNIIEGKFLSTPFEGSNSSAQEREAAD